MSRGLSRNAAVSAPVPTVVARPSAAAGAVAARPSVRAVPSPPAPPSGGSIPIEARIQRRANDARFRRDRRTGAAACRAATARVPAGRARVATTKEPGRIAAP
jgi:hypothetical protein